MRSKDDTLYASTVRRAPKSWWGKLLALDRKEEDPRRRPARRAIPKKSVWALKGPEELS